MIIRVEPKDWMMYTVLLYFNEGAPHAEDEAIKGYLQDNGLEPKRQFKTQLEGDEFEVITFGGCYLGRAHIDAMAEIQRRVVERELLTEEIPVLLKTGPNAEASNRASSMSDAQLRETVDALIQEYHNASNFETDPEGQLQVMIDARELQQSFLKLLASHT